MEDGQFVEHLTGLGPRVATAMKTFCETVDKGELDIQFEWEESGRRPKAVSISHDNACRAVTVIAKAAIENEEITIGGVLLTVTQSSKDKLRILEDDGKGVVVSIGDIPPVSMRSLHTGKGFVYMLKGE